MDLFHAGLLVDTELAARFPSKVLHGVGDKDLSPVYIRFFETLIQQLSGRTNEWPTLPVLLVTWLFPNHHDRNLWLLGLGSCLQFSEHRLRCILIEITTPAVLNRFLQNRQRPIIR